MKIVIGADHAGYRLKQDLADHLNDEGYEIIDVGTESSEPVDYPDFAELLSRVILDGEAERGILICGSGLGASIAANKIPGIRAGLVHDTYSAHQGVEHDDMNVLVLGARTTGPAVIPELVETFLEARFSDEPRHVRRVGKVKAIEERYCGAG